MFHIREEPEVERLVNEDVENIGQRRGGGTVYLFILEKSQRKRTVKGVLGGRRGVGDLGKGEAQSCMDNKTQGKLLEGRAYVWMITESKR